MNSMGNMNTSKFQNMLERIRFQSSTKTLDNFMHQYQQIRAGTLNNGGGGDQQQHFQGRQVQFIGE